MGDQVLVDLIVKAVATGFEKLSKGFIDIEKANKDAAGALSTFGVNLNALDNPITAVAQGVKSAIDFTVKWAGEIDKLSRNTGLSAEEASKLAIVAGDVGIEIGTLEASLKSMNKDGLELNFATLKKVSAQYNSTQDPVARLKIATDAFGRSAQDMTEILSRSPEELDALAIAAERSGKVMSADGVANAEKFEQSLKQLDDQVKGLQVTAGNILIPTLLKAGDALQTEAKIAAIVAIEFQRMTGQIDYNEAAQRAAAVAAGDLNAVFEEQIPIVHDVNERINDTSLAEERMAQQIDVANLALQGYGSTASAVVVAQQALKLTAEETTGVYAAGISAIQNSNLAEEEKLRIINALKIASGELTVEELARQGAVNNLTLALQLGRISEQEYLDGMAQIAEKGELANGTLAGTTAALHTTKDAMIEVAEAATNLPELKEFRYVITWNREELAALQAEVNSLPGEINGTVGGATGDGYASGVQNMVVPPGYPNDSFPMRVQSGEVVDVWKSPDQRARAMAGGGGDNITNIFNDHRATAMYLADQRRKKRARADALMGM